jgi:hypothetical protein
MTLRICKSLTAAENRNSTIRPTAFLQFTILITLSVIHNSRNSFQCYNVVLCRRKLMNDHCITPQKLRLRMSFPRHNSVAKLYLSGGCANKITRKAEKGTEFAKSYSNSFTLVRKRPIPTERPPLVGEVSANFCE